MKKQLFSILLISVLVLSILSISIISADKGSSGNSGKGNSGSNSGSDSSGSGSDSSNGESSTGSDKENSNKGSSGSNSGSSGSSSDSSSGGSDSSNNGKTKSETKKTFIDAEGNEHKLEIKIESNEEGSKLKIKYEKDSEEEVKTELEIKEEYQDGETKIKVKKKDGSEVELKILPDKASEIAKERLNVFEVENITIEEKVHNNIPRVVYNIQTNKNGKFLGVWKLGMKISTEIDLETGEIIEENRPWWAFLVTDLIEEPICHVSEGNQRETIIISLTDKITHLEHGDIEGECEVICGDGFLILNEEVCELEDTKSCTTETGYEGTQSCNATCSGFEELCTTTESCGDGIINGLEACDDGNLENGDGCDAYCQIEVIEPPINGTIPDTNTTLNNTNYSA